MEEEHLNPMAWVALVRIEKFLGNIDQSQHWSKRLAESGGEEAVAKEWIEAIDSAINRLSLEEE